MAVSAVTQPPLPPTNLYFMAIMRILDVKSGPFHEHSPQLYSIAVGVPNWGKVNSGLFKMYEVSKQKKRKKKPLLIANHNLFCTFFFFIYLLAFRLCSGGGSRETSCRTTYSVRGFIAVGEKRSQFYVRP